MRSFADLLLVAGCAAALLAPAAGWLLGVPRDPHLQEQRALAAAPRWQHSWRTFTADCARWVDDHFGFRTQWIRAQHQFVWRVLGASPRREVVRGADGWLFHGLDGALALHRRTLPPLTPGILRTWIRVLRERAEWMRARGGTYRFVLASEKASVHPEPMPHHLAPLPGVHRGEQLRAALRAHPETGFVDVTEALLVAKQQEPVYLRTDTHWSPFGIATVYRTLAESLARDVAGIAPRDAETLLGARQSQPGGDLAAFCGVADLCTEVVRPLAPRPPLTAARQPQHEGDSSAHWRRAGAPSLARAVLFGDSFADRFAPLLADHFAALDAHATHEFVPARILASGATVAVSEMAERAAVLWLPHNPIAVRPVPTAEELARLTPRAPADPGAVAAMGDRLEVVDGEAELTIAWRARTDAVLTGTIHLAALDDDGRELQRATWPQDPVGSRAVAGTVWLDRILLPAGVRRLQYALGDAAGRRTATIVVAR